LGAFGKIPSDVWDEVTYCNNQAKGVWSYYIGSYSALNELSNEPLFVFIGQLQEKISRIDVRGSIAIVVVKVV